MIQFQILVIIFLLRREHQLPPFPYAKIIRYGRKEAGMTTEYWIGLILALGANIAAVAAGGERSGQAQIVGTEGGQAQLPCGAGLQGGGKTGTNTTRKYGT